MFEFREIKSETKYKPLELKPDAPFTQSWFFGGWQEKMGRKVRRFEIKENSETIGFFQMIKYPLPFGQNFLYIPHAPLLRQDFGGQASFFDFFKKQLTKVAKEENAVFIRFDLYFHNSNYGSKEIFGKYFYKTPSYAYNSSYFQPKYEWILDLGKTEKELLANIHSKTRYNIGLAERKGIKMEIISENFKKYFDGFYKLLEKTAKRDNFNLHPKIYYQNIFQDCEKNQNIFLVVAKYGSKILAINLILLFGETAYFIFGGSSDEHKNLMAPHLGHWKGILEAKRRNYKFYNFGAINPSTSLRASKFEGISRFKKGFGGRILEYSDSYDLVLKSFWYYLYNLRKKFF